MRQSIHKPLPAEYSGGDKRPIIRNPDPPDWYEVKVAMYVQVQDPTDKEEIAEAFRVNLKTMSADDFEILESEKV